MSHKVCQGDCGGVSKEEGAACTTEGCSNQNKAMEECGCGDDNHEKK